MDKKPNKPKIPIQVTRKIVHEVPIQFSVLTFYWQTDEFVNINTGDVSREKYWGFGNGSADLSRPLSSGVFPVIDGVRQKDKIYGIAAMAYLLSQLGCPCSVEQAKALVEECKAKNLSHANLCRKSDLIPVSPQDYDEAYYGPNVWQVIAKYPPKDVIAKNVSENLRLAGSPLRMRGTLKYVLKENE